MAPNTKQLNLIVQQLSPADLALAKPHFAPLTQAAPVQQKEELTAEEKQDYWAWEEPEQCAQDSYWDWSSNPSEDFLSANHIVKNLVKSHKDKTDLVRSNVDSDDYWNETSAKDAEVRTVSAQHVNEEAVESYWEWSSEKVDERKQMIEHILEEEKVRQMLTADHVAANARQEASDLYWNDAEVERHTAIRPVAATGGYWEW